jgi:hypothetical protein
MLFQTSVGDTRSECTNGAGKAKTKDFFDVMGPSSQIEVGADKIHFTAT